MRVNLPGKALGQRTPFERIPTVKLDRRKLNGVATGSVKPEGFRPLHLRVNFIPTKVKLKLAARTHPPFDFHYRKGVDRPTNVFAPDQRDWRRGEAP